MEHIEVRFECDGCGKIVSAHTKKKRLSASTASDAYTSATNQIIREGWTFSEEVHFGRTVWEWKCAGCSK